MKLATTILALAFLSSCDPGPPTSSSSSSSTTTTTEGSTTGCVPHLAQMGGAGFGCLCDALLVEPELCGCELGADTCSCPSYPCAEVTCAAPCELGEAFCECGSLVAPADSLHCAGG